ncbi:MAG: hypothetical protein ACOY3P_20360 [Planctomycetota bacterium]
MIERGKPFQYVPFFCRNRYTGAAATGIAANLTCKYSLGTNFTTALTNTTATEIGRGWYKALIMTAAECNGDYLLIDADCTDSDIDVYPTVVFPQDVQPHAKARHGLPTYFVASTGAASNLGTQPGSPFASISSVPTASVVVGLGSLGTVTAALNTYVVYGVGAILQVGAYTASDCVFHDLLLQCKGDFDRCQFRGTKLFGVAGTDHNLTGDDNLFIDCTAYSTTSKGLTTLAMNRSLMVGGAPILPAGTAWTLSGSNNTFINVDFGAVNFTISGNNNRFINCQHTGTRTDNGTGNVWDASPVTSDATIAKLRFDAANRVAASTGGIAIGNDPGYVWKPTLTTAEGKVLSSETPDVSDTQVLDATERERFYVNAASVGTQWQITVETLQDDPGGVNPAPTYSSSDTGVATVTAGGLVEYVGDGEAVIAIETDATPQSTARRNEVRVTNSHSEEAGYTVTEWIPDAVVPADHVLVIFNADNADSIEVKNYYLANRPGMSGAQTIGITGCPATEYVEDGLFDSTVRAQLASYLGANSIIRYIVVCRGIPTRLTTDGGDRYYQNGEVCSASHRLAYCLHDAGVRTGLTYLGATNRFSVGQYQKLAGLVTHIDMGSQPATIAYIDKLAAMGALAGALDADGVTISASGAGAGGDIYVLDGVNAYLPAADQVTARYDALVAEGVGTADIQIAYPGGANITAAEDVGAYFSWGVHTIWTGDYATDGSVTFGGTSNWYLIQTYESFNGVLTSSHGTYADWFSATAFGGSDYSNTPVGAAVHTAEPWGATLFASFFAAWDRGWNFAECFWSAYPHKHMAAIGDPLVRK